MIVAARTSDDPRKGLSHFVLDRKEHPYEVREIHKIASNAQSTAQIFLNDMRVPAANMLGKEGDALQQHPGDIRALAGLRRRAGPGSSAAARWKRP